MFMNWKHPAVRVTGRWDRRNEDAVITTNSGSYIEIAYYGEMVVLFFNLENNKHPYPHLWIQVDGGASIEASVEPFIRIHSKENAGKMHLVTIIFKSSVEVQNRWLAPLEAKVAFKGIRVDAPGILAEDQRIMVEFVGDSITEGVLVDTDTGEEGQETRVYQDDVCAAFPWLTAEKLNVRPRIMGYGAVGITREGLGGVPQVTKSYPFVYDGCPLQEQEPKYIVINHGTNDSFNLVSEEKYKEGYLELLNLVRKINPNSQIICLSIFIGEYTKALKETIEEFNRTYRDKVIFIDTIGWIPREPVHPMRDGTAIISDKLSELLRPIIGSE